MALSPEDRRRLTGRGPDNGARLHDDNVDLHAWVLHMRHMPDCQCAQPLRLEDGSILLYNGELYASANVASCSSDTS